MVFPSWFLRTLLAGGPVGRWARRAARMGSKWINKNRGGKEKKRTHGCIPPHIRQVYPYLSRWSMRCLMRGSLVTWWHNNNHLQLIGQRFKYGCCAARELYNTKIWILHSRTHTWQRVLLINSLWVLVFSSINSLKASLSRKNSGNKKERRQPQSKTGVKVMLHSAYRATWRLRVQSHIFSNTYNLAKILKFYLQLGVLSIFWSSQQSNTKLPPEKYIEIKYLFSTLHHNGDGWHFIRGG